MPQNGSPMNMTQRPQQAMSQPAAGMAPGTRPTLPQQAAPRAQQALDGAQRIVNAQNAVKNPAPQTMQGQNMQRQNMQPRPTLPSQAAPQAQAAVAGQRPSPGEVAQRLGMSVEDLARNPRLYWSAIGFSPPQQAAPQAQPPMQPRRPY